jgi:NAD+-dependent protein deacetylase SIR2
MSSLSLDQETNVQRERHPSPVAQVAHKASSLSLNDETMSSESSFAVEIPVSTGKTGIMEAGRLPCEVLDLTIHGIEASELCRRTMKAIAGAKRIIVVAGAGISVAAGIPDFRSPSGLFATLRADTKYKPSGKALFDASVYQVLRI